MQPLPLALLLVLPLATASNSSNSTDDGLSGGAIAGIVIGALAGVAVIGGIVFVLFFKEGAMYGSKKSAPTPAPTSVSMSDNHLPMVALRVNEDDGL